ncbi:MAG: hypothetical protein PUI22_07085 [Bacteroidales bacterium]|nr:hypothetical protein [Bacteroidales bacterium]MDY5263377.1 hypothetical protein [Candidatus Cryptobacteroides sp.]
MREIVKHLIMLLAVSLLLSSCGIVTNTASTSNPNIIGTKLGDRCNLNLKVFQTLSKTEALCTQEGSYSMDVYKIVTETNILYDGQIIGGTWVLVDTYTYETKDNSIKTVPVLMPLSEYKAALKE